MGCASSRTTKTKVIEIDPRKPPPEPNNKRSKSATPSSSESSTSIGVRLRAASADLVGLRRRKEAVAGGKPTATSSAHSRATVSNVRLRGVTSGSALSRRSKDSGFGTDSREQSAKLKKSGVHVPLTDLAAESAALVEKEDETEEGGACGPVLEKTSPQMAPLRQLPADEKTILDSLRQEGLLNDPTTSTNRGGLVYEVPLGDLQPVKKPNNVPARLLRLEDRRRQLELTRTTLREKLDEAERRRKKREREKVERSREKDAQNLQIKLALMDFEKQKENTLRNDLDGDLRRKASKRQDQIDRLVVRQKENVDKVETARQRKQQLMVSFQENETKNESDEGDKKE